MFLATCNVIKKCYNSFMVCYSPLTLFDLTALIFLLIGNLIKNNSVNSECFLGFPSATPPCSVCQIFVCKRCVANEIITPYNFANYEDELKDIDILSG